MSGIVGSRFNTRGSGLVGSVGTDGQVFTSSGAGVSHTFEDAAGGGAWNILKTVTASDASSADFVHGSGGVDLTTYTMYRVIGSEIDASVNDSNLQILFSDDTGVSYETSSYLTMMNYTNMSGTASTSSTTDSALFMNNVGNDTGETGSFEFHLPNPKGALHKASWWTGLTEYHAGTLRTIEGGSIWQSTADVDAFQFKMSSGTFSGYITLYGIATS